MKTQRTRLIVYGCAALLACLPLTSRAAPVTIAAEDFNTLGTAAEATLPAPWRIDASSSLSDSTARRPVTWADATNATTRAFMGTMKDSSTGGI